MYLILHFCLTFMNSLVFKAHNKNKFIQTTHTHTHTLSLSLSRTHKPVSYTHLDVYKRQIYEEFEF